MPEFTYRITLEWTTGKSKKKTYISYQPNPLDALGEVFEEVDFRGFYGRGNPEKVTVELISA